MVPRNERILQFIWLLYGELATFGCNMENRLHLQAHRHTEWLAKLSTPVVWNGLDTYAPQTQAHANWTPHRELPSLSCWIIADSHCPSLFLATFLEWKQSLCAWTCQVFRVLWYYCPSAAQQQRVVSSTQKVFNSWVYQSPVQDAHSWWRTSPFFNWQDIGLGRGKPSKHFLGLFQQMREKPDPDWICERLQPKVTGILGEVSWISWISSWENTYEATKLKNLVLVCIRVWIFRTDTMKICQCKML